MKSKEGLWKLSPSDFAYLYESASSVIAWKLSPSGLYGYTETMLRLIRSIP